MHEVNIRVLEMKEEHRDTWRDRPPAYWYGRLAEEMGQLGAALIRQDEPAVKLQLQRIASIALNWLEMREV